MRVITLRVSDDLKEQIEHYAWKAEKSQQQFILDSIRCEVLRERERSADAPAGLGVATYHTLLDQMEQGVSVLRELVDRSQLMEVKFHELTRASQDHRWTLPES